MTGISGALKVKLPNGSEINGCGLTSEGYVFMMDVSGRYLQVHPAVVEAFAKGMVPNGIWLAAFARMQTKDSEVRKLGAGVLDVDPTK